jgi:hypothetical protein
MKKLVAALVSCLLLVSSGSYAATIYACKKKVNGQVRIVRAEEMCLKSEVKISWPDLADADARYLPGSTAPEGVTLRGTWKVGGHADGDVGTHAVGDISFGYTFAAAPTVQFIQVGGPTTAECPGSVDAPEALPGYLCLYEEAYWNNDWLHWDPPKRFGVNLYLYSLSGFGAFWSRGTWAATSP